MYRNTHKKEKIKYEKVMRKIEALKSSFESVNKSSNHNNSSEDLFMPKETEERILSELDKLEETAFFIQKDISLSFLAIKLNTNPKYLSYVINTHKGKDFNNYINELRVRFAIDKLHTDPNYLNYKLSYIAEECGFSSHSKFAAVFKSVTELSPSVFVSHLKQDMLEEA
jgi:AraC-like DNA-binding protein